MPQFFCETCHEPFDCSLNRPLIYPCGHTFCFKCTKETFSQRNYVVCPDCNQTHFGHFSKYTVNFAILDHLLKHTDTPIPISKVDYNEIVKVNTEISFTLQKQLPKRKILENEEEISSNSKDEFSSLFNYFELMRQIINYTDAYKNNFLKKLFHFIYKPLMCFLLMILNWLILQHYEFGYVFLFISIMYEKSNNIKGIAKKTKMFSLFAVFFLIETFLSEIGMQLISNVTIVKNGLTCVRTIFIIIVLGNEYTLNWAIGSLFTVMNNMNLLLK